VQRWRERHPGYWRKKRSSRPDALQDLAPSEVSQNQPITISEIGLLADDFGLCEASKSSKTPRAGALQDLAYVQVPLLAGVVSLLIGDAYAKRPVQAILRRCGRGQDTDLRILSDGEDGLRGVVGTWFGKKCAHRLNWLHVARRIARIEKEFLYLPYGDDFQERLAAHWANLNSMKWILWNDGVEMAEFVITRVRIGLFQHALAHPEANSEQFESIEAKLDELRFIFVCEP
jgi:hypothetical protein